MIHEAVILSTGDEITTGRIVDTNSNYIADKLAEVGIEVVAVLTVGDVPERLEWAWKTAMAMADVVISTGGIGPTADDLTNETVARITGKKLVRDQESVDHMKRIFASINRVMPENNLKQADLPETSEVIRNPLGTAPGFRMAVPQADGHTCHLVVLPGVPREMKPMMEDSVLPWLRKKPRQRYDLRRARLPDLRHQRVGPRRGGRRADQARGGAGRVSCGLPTDFAAGDGRGQAG